MTCEPVISGPHWWVRVFFCLPPNASSGGWWVVRDLYGRRRIFRQHCSCWLHPARRRPLERTYRKRHPPTINLSDKHYDVTSLAVAFPHQETVASSIREEPEVCAVTYFRLIDPIFQVKMSNAAGSWSLKFPVYQIDFTATAAGKRVAATKRKIRW